MRTECLEPGRRWEREPPRPSVLNAWSPTFSENIRFVESITLKERSQACRVPTEPRPFKPTRDRQGVGVFEIFRSASQSFKRSGQLITGPGFEVGRNPKPWPPEA